MKRVFLITTLMFLLVSAGWGRDLSLSETVRLAVDHSIELKKAHLASQSARSQYDIALARRFPTLSVDSRAVLISDVPTFSLDLPMGQSLQRELGLKETYQTDISLSVPLYAGGRISAGVDAGRALRALNDALVQANLNQVILQAQVSYLSLYRADKLMAASQAALDRASIISQTVHSMYDAGAADSVDLLESELTMTDSRLTVRETATNRRQQEIRLLVLLGLDPAESIAVTDVFVVPETEVLQGAVALNKPEFAAASSKTAMRRADLRANKGGYLPTISLFGGYSFGKPNRDMFNLKFDDYFSVGARAHWSLNLANENGGRIAVSRFDLQSSEWDEKQVSENLNREAALAYEQLRLARDRYDTARDRATVATSNYRLATAQHADGALATNRLLEIEQTLAAAEASRVAAIADYFISRSGYLYAIGSDLTQEGK